MELKHHVQQYVKGEVPELEVVNLRQIQEIFKIFKTNLLDAMAHRLPEGGAYSADGSAAAGFSARGGAAAAAAGFSDLESKGGSGAAGAGTAGMVGDLDEASGGFHVGLAAAEARPVPRDSAAKRAPGPASSQSPARYAGGAPPQSPPSASVGGPLEPSSPTSGAVPGTPAGGGATLSGPSALAAQILDRPDEATAFESYKRKEGSKYREDYEQVKSELKVKKGQLKTVSLQVNSLKRDIDSLNASIQAKRSERAASAAVAGPAADGVEVIDEEEYALIKACKEKKRDYQDCFQRRQNILNETNYLKNLVEKIRVALANAFTSWYKSTYGVDAGASATSSKSVTFSATAAPPVVVPAAAKRTGGDEDQLDDGEQFERLEAERVMQEDPESMSFYAARKQLMHTMKLKRRGGAAGSSPTKAKSSTATKLPAAIRR